MTSAEEPVAGPGQEHSKELAAEILADHLDIQRRAQDADQLGTSERGPRVLTSAEERARRPIADVGQTPEDGERPGGCRYCEGTGVEADGERCGDCCGLKVDSMLWWWEIVYLRKQVADADAREAALTARALAVLEATS